MRKIAERLQCFSCQNQINLNKYNQNFKQRDPFSYKVDIPLAESLFTYNKNLVNKEVSYYSFSNEFKKEINYFEDRMRNEKILKLKIQMDTDEFLRRINKRNDKYINNAKVIICQNNYLDKYYNDYVQKIYHSDSDEKENNNMYYWIKR